ncbi:Predicted sugar transferase [gamma proteobacterium HdN1]|nr:Predicted sugar transferase [gamma proteobacterium HdN1]
MGDAMKFDSGQAKPVSRHAAAPNKSAQARAATTHPETISPVLQPRNAELRKKVEETLRHEHGQAKHKNPRSNWNNSAAKRWLGASIALLILLILSPLLVGIAAAVKLTSPGPILFAQLRTGYRGRRFRMYKFRTMVADAEARKASLANINQHAGSSPDFKVKNDPRITRIGGFLRKYSLDELPQLFNVVLGDMRLVGPRPTSFDISRYQDHHLKRLTSPPGLTGIWQISGRSNIDFDQRAELDAEYFRNQSLFQDLTILAKTPFAILKGDGAY